MEFHVMKFPNPLVIMFFVSSVATFNVSADVVDYHIDLSGIGDLR